jgi:membrane-associated phospholipid phosphatase
MLAAAVAWSILNGLRWRFILILLLIDGLIPLFYFVHLLTTKEISDWDTTRRRQRIKLYAAVLIIHAVGIIFAWALGKIILAKILLAFWTLALAYTLVTLFWKISLHTGVFATAVAFTAVLWGRNWLWPALILPLIAWSRLRLRKHNLAQVVIGAVLGPVILLSLFNLLNIDRSQVRAPSQEGVFK